MEAKPDVIKARENQTYVTVRTGLPWGAAAIVDDMVGTIYGQTRSEVIRFIVINWLHNNVVVKKK